MTKRFLGMTMRDRIVDRVQYGIDLAITTMLATSSNLSFRLLACGSRGYFAQHGKPCELDEA